MATVSGNLRGLQPSQMRQLEQLYEIHIPHPHLVTMEFVHQLAMLSHGIRQSLCCYLNAAGQVVHVAIGTPTETQFPVDDVGDRRLDSTHLRCITTLFHPPDDTECRVLENQGLDALILLLLHGDDRGRRVVETQVPIEHVYLARPTADSPRSWTLTTLDLDALMEHRIHPSLDQ